MLTASEVDGHSVLHRAADTGDEDIVAVVLEALRIHLTHEEVNSDPNRDPIYPVAQAKYTPSVALN